MYCLDKCRNSRAGSYAVLYMWKYEFEYFHLIQLNLISVIAFAFK